MLLRVAVDGERALVFHAVGEEDVLDGLGGSLGVGDDVPCGGDGGGEVNDGDRDDDPAGADEGGVDSLGDGFAIDGELGGLGHKQLRYVYHGSARMLFWVGSGGQARRQKSGKEWSRATESRGQGRSQTESGNERNRWMSD